MESNFSKNLKKLATTYTQKHIAEKTGFSQASINNYISGTSEPSMSFLIALKNAFSISIDDFLLADYSLKQNSMPIDRFYGTYFAYYYNNSSYKGEVHSNLSNTLSYGVFRIVEDNNSLGYSIFALFFKDKKKAVDLFKSNNKVKDIADINKLFSDNGSSYHGTLHYNERNIFVKLDNNQNDDECFIIFNNPPTNAKFLGGLGTINSISRGREHNPCLQYLLLTNSIIEKTDNEIYDLLKLDYASIDFRTSITDLVTLFKRLYIQKNELSTNLTDFQKESIIENQLKYYFNEIVDANMFRFAKVSNREDDALYRLIKESDYDRMD